MRHPSKKLSFSEAKQKIFRFCAYQERCHQEVRRKLYEFHLSSSEVDELITFLITEGFLNEERFARAFAGGKFRMKRWGKMKIVRELEAKGITANCIKAALSEINNDDYLNTLRTVLAKKRSLVLDGDPFVRNNKIASFAIQKGYEPDLVWQFLKEENDPAAG